MCGVVGRAVRGAAKPTRWRRRVPQAHAARGGRGRSWVAPSPQKSGGVCDNGGMPRGWAERALLRLREWAVRAVDELVDADHANHCVECARPIRRGVVEEVRV